MNVLYRFLRDGPLFREYTRRIEHRVEIYHPIDKISVKEQTLKIILRAFLGSTVCLVLFLLFGKPTPYYFALVLSILFMIHMHIVYASFEKKEIKLLKEFEKFLSDVRFYFGFHGIVEEAILDARDKADYVMGLQAEYIYKILTMEEYETQADAYMETAPNRFFATFFALCQTVMNYGDKKVAQKSLFLTNLSYIKEEIHLEIMKKERAAYLFSGLLTITAAPLFSIRPLEKWALSNTASLESYYNGAMGILTTILIFITGGGCYWMITKLRYEMKPIYEESSILKKISEWRMVEMFFVFLMNHNYGKYLKKSEEYKATGQIENIKIFMLKEFFTGCFLAGMSAFFLKTILIASVHYNGMSSSKFQWYHAGIIFLFGVAGFFLPRLKLFIKKQLLRMDREEEVVRFQTIILILMHIDRITVETILEWMENFASAFKNTIARTIDEMEYEGMEAIEKCKMRETFLPFIRVLDGLMSCDKIPVYEAFDEVESDRNYYLEKHKQENEAYVNDKAVVGRTIAYIPMFLTVACKLIVPFVLEGLNQLSSYQNFMN